MPILRTPQSSAALTILNLVALALHRMSTALPRVWAEFPLLPFDLSQEDERQAQFSTNGMPARSLTSSNRERNAPSISLSEQDGTHFLNSLSEKYLLIVCCFFESAYLYYLCHYSKLSELPYKYVCSLTSQKLIPSLSAGAPILTRLTFLSFLLMITISNACSVIVPFVRLP